MNPFSAFLQPPRQQSPLAGAGEFVQGLQQLALQKRAQEFREKESGLDNTRADAHLKLQQGYQNRTFTDKDQEKLQGLLAAYKQAEDQGDQVQMARALQDLQAFGGADISKGGMDPRAAAFTGGKAPPSLPGMLPGVQIAGQGGTEAFTGTPPDQANPIGDAIKAEQESRDKLRARTESPDLSQEDFEADLIANPTSVPESPDEEVIDLDQDSPAPLQIGGLPSAGTKDYPVPEGTVDGGDLDAQETRTQAPQAAASQTGPSLPGMLPTVISKGGKRIYESTGPSGRWQPMVSSVFDAFTKNENPELAAAGQRAKELAGKLISVDGISPKDAIEFAAKRYEAEASRITNLERTRIGSQRKGGGGGGSAVQDMALTSKELALLGDDAQQLMLSITAKPEYQKVSVMDDVLNGAEDALGSDDPVRQQQALSDIMRARSGLTVRKDEEASLRHAAGMWEGIMAKLSQSAGYGLTEDYRHSLAQAITAQRSINQRIRRRIAEETKRFYITTRTTSDTDTGSRAKQVKRNAEGIGTMLGRNGADPNADLDQ